MSTKPAVQKIPKEILKHRRGRIDKPLRIRKESKHLKNNKMIGASAYLLKNNCECAVLQLKDITWQLILKIISSSAAFMKHTLH